MMKLQIALGLIAAAIGGSIAKEFQLQDVADYEVNRALLEKSYPAFKSFHGSMHAGLIPAAIVDDENESDASDFSSYFFVLFLPDTGESLHAFRNDTLLVWLNGGPGCSSMTGMIAEMGPIGTPKFHPGTHSPNPAPLVPNEYAWTRKTAMLFVEQPGGVGFSKASKEWTGEEADKRTENDVATSFYAFLRNFYTIFGRELAEKKLYLTGQSYAGMYIPSIAREIHLRNKRISSKDKMNLRGLAIGNGWIDAKIQASTYVDYAWWHGMIDLQDYRGLKAKWEECVLNKILDSSEVPFHSFTTSDECGIIAAVIKASGNEFMYDVTSYDAYPAIIDKGTISSFFNDPDVRNSLNAPSLDEDPYWSGCVPGAGRRRRLKRDLLVLENDRPLSVVPFIAELLDDAHLDILMYNGDLDLAVTAQGTELSLASMEWSGAEGWMDPNATKWHQWIVDGEQSGHMKTFKNLQFLIVYNSGHFVPVNQARRSLDMIGRLLEGKSLGDKELPRLPVRKDTQVQLQPTEERDTPRTRVCSLLVIGFFLGVLATYAVSKVSVIINLSPPSAISSLQRINEATPLRAKTGV